MYDPIKDVITSTASSTTTTSIVPPSNQINVANPFIPSTSTSHRQPPLPPLPQLAHRHYNQQLSSSSDTHSTERHRPRDIARSPPQILASTRNYSYRLPATHDSVRSGGVPRSNDLSRFSMDRYPLHGQPLQTQPPPPPPLSSSSSSLEYSSRAPYSHHQPGQYPSHSQTSHLSGHPLPPGPPPPPLSSYRPQSRGDGPGVRPSSPSSGSSPTVNHAHDASQNGGSVAGVKPTLKRNQACLQCRRRKLKCDAARPHCKTCVRSFNHALRGAEASRRERIRERQRERGEEERDDNDVNDEEPPAESLIPPLSCTYEDPTEIQAKRQESAALTQKRYGQQIGAARILVEGLAGGSGLVRVDSSGDENWAASGGATQGGGGDGASRHPGSRKRSVGSLMGRNPTSPEYERAGKRREISQSRDQQQSHLFGSESRRDELDPGAPSSYMSPESARAPSSSSYRQRNSPGSARRPPGSDSGYPPSLGYPHHQPSQPPLSSNPSSAAPYPYTPGPGPSPGQTMMKPNPWGDHGLPTPGMPRGYEGHPSSYDRGLDTPHDGMLGFHPGNPAYIHPGLHPLPPPDSGGSIRRSAPPYPEPLLPPTGAYGPPESSTRESLNRESMHAPSSLNGSLGETNGGPHGLPPHAHEPTSSLRSSGFSLMNGSSHSGHHHGSSRTPSMNGHNLETGPSNGDFRDEPVWGYREMIAGVPVRKTPTPEAEENGQLRSKIAWLQSELRQAQDRSIVDPSLTAVDMARTPSAPGEAGTSNRSARTGEAEDGNMLALLSQAIDQTGYQPVPRKPTSTSTGYSKKSGGSGGTRKAAAVTQTHPGSTTPLEPKNIFEIGPAESWEATMASSRARTLANILNDAPAPELPTELKTYPLETSGTDLPKDSPSQLEAEPVLWDLLWPGWHKDLPNPELMDHICEVFFHHVPTVTRLFHYETFKARMALPTTHKDFPNVAVLHGICAATARYTARVFTCNPEDEPWLRACQHMEEPIREEDFGIRHSLFAWNAVNRQLASGTNIYECAQACILLANHYHMYARWAEGWVGIGLAGRLMAPLGLSLRERPGVGPGPAQRGPLLRPAANDVEREERRALFWAAVLYDAQISASAGWSGTIQFDEIFVPLPASLDAFESGAAKGIPESEQTLFSPDLYTHHPAYDGFSLHVKAICLFHRVNKFVRLAKAKRSMGGAELDFRVTKDFQSLDETIQDFLLTFPSEVRDPLTPAQGRIKKPIDVDLFTSQVLIHQMTIFLHEPFANINNPDDQSTCRMLEAARSILKMIFAVASTCLDLSLIVRADFGLHCAARTLVLFLRNAIETGDTSAGTEEQLRSEIEVFRLAFIAHGKRFPIGLRHNKVLDALLSDCGPGSRQDGNAATLKICDTPSRDTQDGEDGENASVSDDSIDQAEANDPLSKRDVKKQVEANSSPIASKIIPTDAINGNHKTFLIKQEQFVGPGDEYETQRAASSNEVKALDVVMT